MVDEQGFLQKVSKKLLSKIESYSYKINSKIGEDKDTEEILIYDIDRHIYTLIEYDNVSKNIRITPILSTYASLDYSIFYFKIKYNCLAILFKTEDSMRKMSLYTIEEDKVETHGLFNLYFEKQTIVKVKDCEVIWKDSFQEDSAITITKIEQEK